MQKNLISVLVVMMVTAISARADEKATLTCEATLNSYSDFAQQSKSQTVSYDPASRDLTGSNRVAFDFDQITIVHNGGTRASRLVVALSPFNSFTGHAALGFHFSKEGNPRSEINTGLPTLEVPVNGIVYFNNDPGMPATSGGYTLRVPNAQDTGAQVSIRCWADKQ